MKQCKTWGGAWASGRNAPDDGSAAMKFAVKEVRKRGKRSCQSSSSNGNARDDVLDPHCRATPRYSCFGF